MSRRESDLDAWIAPRRTTTRGLSLADMLAAMPGPVFAALDGAQFDDLPAALAAATLKGRSLFLGSLDPETEKAGPWLVDCDSEASLARLLALVGDKPAAVFWSFPAGEVALFRHLRIINEAVVPRPREGARQPPFGERRPSSDYDMTRALFRHWDPRVLIQVLPVLDEGQLARVLGGAALLVMAGEDGRVVEAPALRHEVLAPQGPLRLTVEQVEAISDVRVAESRRKIAAFLRETAPEETRNLSNAELGHMVVAYEASGAELGLKTERSLGIWAHLMVASNGELGKRPKLRGGVAKGPKTQDENLYEIFGVMTLLAQSDRR